MELYISNYKSISYPGINEFYKQWETELTEEAWKLYRRVVGESVCNECYPYDMPGAGVMRREDATHLVCSYCGITYYVSRYEKCAEVLRKDTE